MACSRGGVVLLLVIRGLSLLLLYLGLYFWSLFCGVALRPCCRVAICILYLPLAVHCVGMWSVILAFLAHTR